MRKQILDLVCARVFDDIMTGTLRIERAVEAGPEAVLGAIDDLVSALQADGAVLALLTGAVVDCGNPDCPVHGSLPTETNPN